MLWPGGNFKAELLSALPPVHTPGAAACSAPGMLLESILSMSGSTGCAPWPCFPHPATASHGAAASSHSWHIPHSWELHFLQRSTHTSFIPLAVKNKDSGLGLLFSFKYLNETSTKQQLTRIFYLQSKDIQTHF